MQNDITQTETIDLQSLVSNYSVPSATLDSPDSSKETRWTTQNFDTYLNNYKNIPELKKAIDTYATWVLGNGYSTESSLKQIELEAIRGMGKENFLSILKNMLRVKKFNGDAYAEIIRNENGKLINLKPITPKRVTHIFDEKRVLIRYEFEQSNKEIQKLTPDKVFHLINDRVADEMHGVSVVESAKWVIETRQEVLADLRRIAHLSTVRVLFVNEDDKTRRTQLKIDYASGIETGNVIILPGKPGDASFQDLTIPPTEAYLRFIEYLENFFYKIVGVPESALGGVQGTTEAGAKVGLVAFDPIYKAEIMDLENDIWNQLFIRVHFTGQKSMMDNIQADQQANTGQTKLEFQGGQ